MEGSVFYPSSGKVLIQVSFLGGSLVGAFKGTHL